MKKRLTATQAREGRAGDSSSVRLAAFRHFLLDRHFALLWSGQTVSNFGSYITGIGLPLAALLLLHATPAQLAILTALGLLPGLLLGLFIGVWVDRLPRRSILIAADIGRALLLGTIPLLAVSGLLSLPWLYAVIVLAGLLTTLFDIASLAFLPTLLSPEDLPVGNSRLGTSSSLAEVAGPPLAGLLVQALSVPVAILLDVLTFLFSAFCVSQIRVREHIRAAESPPPRLWYAIREGMGVVLRQPMLRALAAYTCMRNFFGGTFAALYLLYAVQLCGENPLLYGLLVAAGGLGALYGSLCAGWCVRQFGQGRALLCSALLAGLLSLCTPLAGGPIPLAFALLAFSQLFGDAGSAIYSINEISLRQRLIPSNQLGRVNSCMHILSAGTVPLGALLAGVLSTVLGVRLTLWLGASGICLSFLWLVFSPLRRLS
ncbi:MAG TPA: MFS transporter [Ktedonobacteraceae bacterium]